MNPRPVRRNAVIVPRTTWDPAPRFVEAATALTIAYMAVEILALPQAGKRWLIAGALGFSGVAGAAGGVAKALFGVFLVLLVIGLVAVGLGVAAI